jgi:hypothetical protein
MGFDCARGFVLIPLIQVVVVRFRVKGFASRGLFN